MILMGIKTGPSFALACSSSWERRSALQVMRQPQRSIGVTTCQRYCLPRLAFLKKDSYMGAPAIVFPAPRSFFAAAPPFFAVRTGSPWPSTPELAS